MTVVGASPARFDAIVVGAGPNGLTAAARLAVAGRKVLVVEAAATIGGGARTSPLGTSAIHDVCSAVHPFGVSSAAFVELGLADHGLQWLHPPIGLAHPFDDGSAATLVQFSVDHPHGTAKNLGDDANRWRHLVDPLSRDWDRWKDVALGPILATALHHPLAMARFGALAALPATALARLFRTQQARALIIGMAAHSGSRLGQPATGGVALALAAASQAGGMPFAKGGSQSIVNALASIIVSAGGTIETNRMITDLGQLPAADAVLLDVTPGQAAAMLGLGAPRWKQGVAAWKLDLVLSGPMPWLAAHCHQAGTIHLGGSAAEIVASERAVNRCEVPTQPFVIVAQPSLADPTRAAAGQHVIWAYRHVPNGCTAAEATAGIESQFDRFAPGWRDLVVHRQVMTATGYAHYNPSYIGGDVAGGALTLRQTIARPALALDPYRTKRTGVWLCSQSTPPGPGVHGMCGWHAAGSVLRGR